MWTGGSASNTPGGGERWTLVFLSAELKAVRQIGWSLEIDRRESERSGENGTGPCGGWWAVLVRTLDGISSMAVDIRGQDTDAKAGFKIGLDVATAGE